MKIKTKSGTLVGAVNAVKGARVNRAEPLLQDFCMVEAVKSDMAYYVMASSDELSMRIKVPCTSVAEDGKMLIAWDTISVLGSLPKDTTISVSSEKCEDGKGFTATYQWKGTSLNFPVEANPDEYPVKGAWVKGECSMAVGASEFREGLKAVSFAMSKDVTRPVMCATWVHHNGSDLEFAASNLQMIAAHTYMGQGTLEGCDDATIVIPARAVALAQAMKGDGAVTLEYDGHDCRIQGNDVEIRWANVPDKVPDYKKCMPRTEGAKCELRFSPADMSGALRRVTMLTDAGHLRLRWETGTATAEVTSEDAIIAYSETMRCEGREVNEGMDGKPVVLGFKSTNLLAVLNNCKSDSLVLHYMDSHRAVYITKDTDTEDVIDRYVVMPVVLKKETGEDKGENESA